MIPVCVGYMDLSVLRSICFVAVPFKIEYINFEKFVENKIKDEEVVVPVSARQFDCQQFSFTGILMRIN